MGISDISEETYAFVLRSVFKYVNTFHSIDLFADDFVLEEDLQYAMYIHAKYIYENQIKNTAVVTNAKDSAGNTVAYNPKLPSIVHSTYKAYSPIEPAILT